MSTMSKTVNNERHLVKVYGGKNTKDATRQKQRATPSKTIIITLTKL